MHLYMLVEPRLEPIPDNIKLLSCFDENLRVMIDDTHESVTGKSVYLEGEEQAFMDWLHPHSPVWVGKGQPFEEHFKEEEIRKE